MHILCAYTDQKLAQQGQKNSTSVFTALTTFRISDGRGLDERQGRWKLCQQRVEIEIIPGKNLLWIFCLHCLDQGEEAKGKVSQWQRGKAEHSEVKLVKDLKWMTFDSVHSLSILTIEVKIWRGNLPKESWRQASEVGSSQGRGRRPRRIR